MKKLLFATLLLMSSGSVFAQKFFVEKTEGGAEQPIINKLLETQKELIFKQDSADYILRCNVQKMSLGRARGGIMIIDNHTGKLVSKSKDIVASTSAFNGYNSPSAEVIKKSVKKYLPSMIDALPKIQ